MVEPASPDSAARSAGWPGGGRGSSLLAKLGRGIANLVRYRLLFWLWHLFMLVATPFGDTLLYVWYRKDLTKPLTPYKARVPIEVRLARVEEIEGVARMDQDSDALVEIFRNRMRMGQLCFVAVIDGQIVGCDWVCPRPELVPGGVAMPADGEVYTTDAFTRPEWRGQNIHPEINYSMLEGAKARGFHRAYTLVNVENPRSWKAVKRVGWEWSGTYVWFRFAWTGREHAWRLAGSLYPMVKLAGSSYGRPQAPRHGGNEKVEVRHG